MNNKLSYGAVKVATQDDLLIKTTEYENKMNMQRVQFNQDIAERDREIAKLKYELSELEEDIHEYMGTVFKLSCGAVAIICLMLVAFVLFF